MNENIGQKILSKDLENIVKKVASGKTLTSAERSLVEKAYGTSGDVKFAKTIVELSEILGVSRKFLRQSLFKFPTSILYWLGLSSI